MSDSYNDNMEKNAPPLEEEIDLSGQQLSDFKLLKRLGQGAMAVVYLARQVSLDRLVAFKVLRRSLAEDEKYIERFRQEAKAAAALVHANIAQVYEVGSIEGTNFIAQEYIEGRNLRDWIQSHPRPKVVHALGILTQLAKALTKAAELEIIHRDIKPENILLARGGEIKVVDFGLARLPQRPEGVELTQIGITLGTPLYMSPEQIEGRPLDPRSDIYSLGITAYHLLAGCPPFEGKTSLSVAVAHLKDEPKPLGEVRPEIPNELCRIVHKMIAKDPDRRYITPHQLLRDLRRLQISEFSDQWSEEIPGWEPTESQYDLSNAAYAMTQRLQTLMDYVEPKKSKRRQIPWPIYAIALFLIGGLSAWLFAGRPSLLYRDANNPGQTPRLDSAAEQMLHASRIDTIGAWQAVINYYPKATNYTRYAKQQLARLHYRRRNYDEALKLFHELAVADPNDHSLQAYGRAGEAIILTRQDRQEEADLAIELVTPMLGDLRDDELKTDIYEILHRRASQQ
ncbi:MAG: protein kinase [Planctomycetia bacterium]|jgi:serine/threonine-protein kinase